MEKIDECKTYVIVQTMNKFSIKHLSKDLWDRVYLAMTVCIGEDNGKQENGGFHFEDIDATNWISKKNSYSALNYYFMLVIIPWINVFYHS